MEINKYRSAKKYELDYLQKDVEYLQKRIRRVEMTNFFLGLSCCLLAMGLLSVGLNVFGS